MISKSGGARMMGLFFDAISKKTSVNLPSLLRKNTLHFTHVQTLLLRNDCILCYVRDINISEPGALIDLQDLEW
jgi:hypothetical protein